LIEKDSIDGQKKFFKKIRESIMISIIRDKQSKKRIKMSLQGIAGIIYGSKQLVFMGKSKNDLLRFKSIWTEKEIVSPTRRRMPR
jgi:hypothetical protein